MFNRIFGGSTRAQLERRILSETAQGHLAFGASPAQANQLARQSLDLAKQEAKQEGVEDGLYREGDGDRHLADAGANPDIRSLLERLRAHGVRDEDFRQWHNLSLLERLVQRQQDNMFILAAYTKLQDEGRSVEESKREIRMTHALYAWNIDEIEEDDPHARLPVELKPRVNSYLLSQSPADAESIRARLPEAGSFNAFVRQQIAAGLL